MNVGRGRPVILIVDDNPELAMGLLDLLEAEGYEAHVALNGHEALQKFSALDGEALVLLDLRLPDIPGRELIERFIPMSGPNARIVAMTGFEDEVHGVHSVLRKPFDIDELYAVLERYCPAPARTIERRAAGSH